MAHLLACEIIRDAALPHERRPSVTQSVMEWVNSFCDGRLGQLAYEFSAHGQEADEPGEKLTKWRF
jgi:hypothetical protein